MSQKVSVWAKQSLVSFCIITASVAAELYFMMIRRSKFENIPEYNAHAFYLKPVNGIVHKWLFYLPL